MLEEYVGNLNLKYQLRFELAVLKYFWLVCGHSKLVATHFVHVICSFLIAYCLAPNKVPPTTNLFFVHFHSFVDFGAPFPVRLCQIT